MGVLLLSDKIKSIIFVCTGNTCRSPMAEALMKKLLSEENINDIDVFSRGISVFENSPASDNSIEACKKYDIDLSYHKSKLLSADEIKMASLILTMTSEHKQAIISFMPECKDKIFSIYEFAFGQNKNISDPFGATQDVYEKCLDEIAVCLNEIVNKLKNENCK